MNNPSACPHFLTCSGCTLTDIFNPPVWNEALAFFRKHAIEPEWVTQGFSHTRLKAKLAVRPQGQIGLFKRGTHDVIAIPNCLVHHPSINQAAALLQKTGGDFLRYAQMFVEQATGKVQLALVASQEFDVKGLLQNDLWHSIWFNIHPMQTNRILGDSWKLMYGEPFVWQTLSGIPIPFHPGAFSQTHLPLFEKILEKVASWVPAKARILELYAGVGAIGLCLAGKAEHITLIENNPFAHLCYQQTPRPNISYHCIDAQKADFSHVDVVIVDPPRKGLDFEVLSRLDGSFLIYISCGFDSFKRDAELLLERGWTLKEAAGYLLFPGTNHIETVALFSV